MMLIRKAVAVWLLAAAAALSTCSVVMSRRLDVGDRLGWTQDVVVNYTEWASHNHFYVGDWLYFRFDKHRYNVLEVNRSNYDSCNDREFIANITRGGRDVFQLKEARPYYFLSGGGYCYNGLKLAINVTLVPAPAPSPETSATTPVQPSCQRVLLLSAMVAAIQALVIRSPGIYSRN